MFPRGIEPCGSAPAIRITLITAAYRYYADWDNDGSFGDLGENISAYAFESSWEYGRDFASQLSGRCSRT